MWKPQSNRPWNLTHKQRFKREFMAGRLGPNDRKFAPLQKKTLWLAKSIIEHLRQWERYGKQTTFHNIPQKAVYPLDLMLWANNRIKRSINSYRKGGFDYYASSLSPEPFEEDWEIAAIYVAMHVHGQKPGPNVRPIACVNERYVTVINLLQD